MRKAGSRTSRLQALAAAQNTATSDDRLQKVIIYIVVAAAVAFVAAKVLK